MAGLQHDTALKGEGPYEASLSPDWELWGPNGGYLSAIALRAAGRAAPSEHRPVSYTCHYLSNGAFAPTDVTVEPLREGRQAWCQAVSLRQGARNLLQAQVWTTSGTGGPTAEPATPPQAPLPDSLEQLPEADPQLPGGRFRNNFDRRPVLSDPAFLRQGRFLQWFRFRDYDGAADPFLDASRFLLLIDTMVLPAHVHGQGGRIDYQAMTLSMAAAIHEPAFDADWLLVESCSNRAAGGAIYGEVRVWTADQRLVASGSSVMLVLDRNRPIK